MKMRASIPWARGASALALLTFLADCGGGGAPEPEASSASDTPAASANPVDVCGLLTTADIEEVLEKTPGEPEDGSPGMSECSWPSLEGPSPLVHLAVTTSGLESFQAFVQSYQSEFGGEEPPREYFAPIEGLGTWAMYRVDDELLEVHIGERLLELKINPPSQDKAVALARKAIPKLP
jgi:hypothetical protein